MGCWAGRRRAEWPRAGSAWPAPWGERRCQASRKPQQLWPETDPFRESFTVYFFPLQNHIQCDILRLCEDLALVSPSNTFAFFSILYFREPHKNEFLKCKLDISLGVQKA